MNVDIAMALAGLLIFIPQILVYLYHMLLLTPTNRSRSQVIDVNPVKPRGVSFILPVRKEPLEYIEEAARYIHSLGIEDYELIIVSDDPVDSKSKLLDLYINLKKDGVNAWFIWRSEPRGFKSGALNTGLYASRGDYIYIVDVDSRPEKCFFEKAIGILEREPGVIGVIGRWEPRNQSSRVSEALAVALRFYTRILYEGKWKKNLFTYPLGTGTLYKSRVLKEVFKGWDENRVTDDLELGGRILSSGFKLVYLNECAVYVENPDTYKSFRIQQSRWIYGAVDTAISRFKHIVKAPVKPIVKLDAFFHLLQYIPQAIVFLGAFLASLLVLLGVREPLLTRYLFIVWLVFLAMYSLVMKKYTASNNTEKYIVQIGRLSALTVAISYIAFYKTVKAVLRVKEGFKRTPKGVFQTTVLKKRIPWELIFGVFFFTAGLKSMLTGGMLIGLWLTTYSLGYLYVVYRFPRDVFYE